MNQLKAISDVQIRTWSLKDQIEKFIVAYGEHIQLIIERRFDNPEDQKKLSSLDRSADAIITDVHHWYKSIEESALPKEVRKEIKKQFKPKVKEKVKHLRNIKEHWEKNRKYFENLSIEIPINKKTASARWFRHEFPEKTPWSFSWSNVTGFTICGVLNIQELLSELEKIEKILPAIKGNLNRS